MWCNLSCFEPRRVEAVRSHNFHQPSTSSLALPHRCDARIHDVTLLTGWKEGITYLKRKIHHYKVTVRGV